MKFGKLEIVRLSGRYCLQGRLTGLLTFHRFFIIAVLSTIAIGLQNFLFADAAAALTFRLRALSFTAMLRQDSKPYLSLFVYSVFTLSQLSTLTKKRTAYVQS